MKFFLLIITIVSFTTLIYSELYAQEDPCDLCATEESSIYYLQSWKEIYQSFKKCHQCDDGSLAEAYSDKIAKMLAYHWEQLDELAKIVAVDKEFHDFVLKHIDDMMSPDEAQKILINCRTRCPMSLSKLCSEIEKQCSPK